MPKITATLFKGKSTQPHGPAQKYTWAELVDELEALVQTEGDKLALPSLIFAEFSGPRCNANMGASSAITIDVDDPGDVDALLRRLEAWRCFVYETPSSTDDAPRLRVVVPLAKPIPVDAVPHSKLAFAEAVGLDPVKSGVAGAKAASQPSFFGRLPGTRERAADAFEGTVWRGPQKAPAPAQEGPSQAAPPGYWGRRVPDLSAIAEHVPPAGHFGERRKLVRALGGWLALAGYSPDAIAEAVATQIPSDSPAERGELAKEAAERALSGEVTAGWGEIERWVSEVADGAVDLPAFEAEVKDPDGWIAGAVDRWEKRSRVLARRESAEKAGVEIEPEAVDLLQHLELDGDGVPLAMQSNVSLCVRHLLGDTLARDAATGRVLLTKPKRFADVERDLVFEAPDKWGPIHTTRLHELLCREPYAIRRASRSEIDHAIVSVSADRMWWPIKEYLSSLVWDGKHRCLTTYLGAEPTTYHRGVCAMWLRSAVARGVTPGCQADHMLILEGAQGVGKTSALRILGGEWYAAFTARPDDAKASGEQMQGAWIVEVAEFDKFTGSYQAAALKDLITRNVDRYRQAYQRDVEPFPRTAVFAASTNADLYLTDETGARRMWPVAVGDLDLDGLRRDRDQIWAQAAAEVAAGGEDGQWWPTEELKELAEEQAADRSTLIDDPWLPSIEEWLAKRRQPFAVRDLVAFGRGAIEIELSQVTPMISRRIGWILKGLGCPRLGGGRWGVPE